MHLTRRPGGRSHPNRCFAFTKESGMTKNLLAIIVALSAALGLAGCGSRAETVGTVGGAAAGGAVGSAVSGGSTLGTIGGAAAGGYIGNQMGEEYDKRNKK
jgi:osmotically inducible lipoprotein OsmB